MNFLEERILKDGIVKEGNVLKVDSFLNHQMDINLFKQMGEEFKRRFADKNINKIMTIEASGIGIACVVASYFDVPVVFAKKSQSINIDGDVYVAEVESLHPQEQKSGHRIQAFLRAGGSRTDYRRFPGKWLRAPRPDFHRGTGRRHRGRYRNRRRKGLPVRRTDDPEPWLSAGVPGHRREHGRSNRKCEIPRSE